jgi:hypothetical protein
MTSDRKRQKLRHLRARMPRQAWLLALIGVGLLSLALSGISLAALKNATGSFLHSGEDLKTLTPTQNGGLHIQPSATIITLTSTGRTNAIPLDGPTLASLEKAEAVTYVIGLSSNASWLWLVAWGTGAGGLGAAISGVMAFIVYRRQLPAESLPDT